MSQPELDRRIEEAERAAARLKAELAHARAMVADTRRKLLGVTEEPRSFEADSPPDDPAGG